MRPQRRSSWRRREVKVLLDECLDWRLGRDLPGYEVRTVQEMGWDGIKNGDEIMQKTSSSLEELMSRMDFFFRMMEVISTSSTEQTQNIGELSRAITQIDGSTQNNASTVEELANTLDNLRSIATVLAEDVQKFKTSQRDD